MSAPVLYVNTDLVATAWLLSLSGISSGMVGTTLPRDNASWAERGFLVVSTLGGGPNIYTTVREPVISLDAWWVAPNSNKPPWGKANNLIETVLTATFVADGLRLTLPGDYPAVRLLQAWAVTEPRRINSDPGDYARYNAHLGLSWVTA